MTALITNLRGSRAGRETGLAHLNFVFSASEKHNLNNVNKTIQEFLAELRAIAAQADRDGIGLCWRRSAEEGRLCRKFCILLHCRFSQFYIKI
ncbi:MAG: hypothetical protein AB1556_02075 [Bacillota bacterium]